MGLRRSFKRLKRQCTLRCKSLPDSSSLDVSSRAVDAIDSESESHHSSVHFCGRAGSVQDILVSSSAVNARLVPRDADVLQVQTGKHALAAVFTAQGSAPTPGLSFIKAKLLLHMQIQARIHAGKASAVAAAFATLTSAFQWLPVQADIFQNLDISLVYINLEDNMVYTGTVGQCSTALYSKRQQDAAGSYEPDSFAQPAQGFPLPTPRGAQSAQQRTLQAQAFPLDRQTDAIVLGSAGFWNEVTQEKALLRLHHHTREAPTASDRNPALHLTNFALHNVARRQQSREEPHPCTPDMTSVAALQSLWVGSADEEGNAPAHLRYRGDVYGDMSVIVIQLAHAGSREAGAAQALSRSISSQSPADYSRAALQSSSRGSSAKQRWAFLRMHFRTFAAASRQQTQERWYAVVSAAQAAAREAAEAEAMKLQAAEAFLFGGSPSGSLLWPEELIKAFSGASADCSKGAQELALRLLRPSYDVAAGI